LREWSVPEYGGWEKRMPKVVITITADEMPHPEFTRDLVEAVAKQLHELYSDFGPCGRRALIGTPIGAVKFVWVSEKSFWLGAHTYYLEDGKWKTSLFDHKAGISK
jgi:hypothetical protein